MRKLSRKVCLLLAGTGLGWAWESPANAASLVDRADIVFADNADMSVELVDYQKKLERQQMRACKEAEREQNRIAREYARAQKRACRDANKACRGGGGGMDWGGWYDTGAGWCGDGYDSMCGMFGDPLDDPWTLSGAIADAMCLDEPCIDVGGWFQFGYTNKSDGVFNTVPHALNLHQAWFYVESAADGSEGFDVGGRIDVVYGIDAQNTQAFGNRPGRWDFENGYDHGEYGWAIPQAYGELAYDAFSVKIGHFYTLQGFEVVGATGNFFYSHLLTMNFMEPFTHTGAVGTYQIDDDTALYGGWVAGWDTGFDRLNGGSAFHGGFSFSPMENMSFIYTTTAGNFGWSGEGYAQSIVVTTQLTDELTSVIGGDLIHTNEGVLGGTTFHGISMYNFLLYSISDRTAVGMRNEWAKFDGTSYQVLTVGLNYKPMANMVIRPEYRYQWCPGAEGATPKNPLGIPVDESILGIDAIITF
ncbi:MAG: porin [Planctomyces sp.]|nr:porin [Planctomyces sp.]